MPCYHPLRGFYGKKTNPETGKRPVVFNRKEGYYDHTVQLPCGRCIGCRLERSRQWATRCVHEAQIHPENCFVTLTFREACPLDGTKTDPTQNLYKHHYQRFMKRLRKFFCQHTYDAESNSYKKLPRKHWLKIPGIRYFHCGEYGENLGRPHHHACLFNLDFKDKTLYSIRAGVRLYHSKTLEAIWSHGQCVLGDVTFESAAYVARYVMKKITGENATHYYDGKQPEYSTMSRRPGLGAGWLKKYADDLYPKDFVIIRGKKSKIPKFYDKIHELTNPTEFDTVRCERIINNRGNPNNHPDRMEAAEIIKKAQLGNLPRRLENQ